MKIIFNCIRVFLINPNFHLTHRNRYSEGADDGQITPCGYPAFNSYVENYFFCILDGQTEGDINLKEIIVPPD